MSDSLFSSSSPSGSTPSTSASLPTVTYRLLVSRREAGAIIGKEGANITNIRDSYNIKAGVSKVIDGCIDRILTISGPIQSIPNALVDISKSVLKANIDTIIDCENNNTNPTRLITYDYPPLRSLINGKPNYKSPDYETTLFLRVLIPNSQIGILIGKGGSRIKSIQEENDIKMVASKDFLDNSNERLIELQGTESNLHSALTEISNYLVDTPVQSNVNTKLYIPCSPINQQLAGHQLHPSSTNPQYFPNHQMNSMGKEIIKKISFPNDYIGALIGKRGSRIHEIRILSQCAVAIENQNPSDMEDPNEREITLVGTKPSVDKAIDMLNMYYEKEQKRRAASAQL